jgi:flagellar biosynthesis/type III secretory pathway protein FliH
MQKWCPEPLVSDEEAGALHRRRAAAAAQQTAGDPRQAERQRLFQLDTAPARAEQLLETLSAEEREQLFELVEADVTAAFTAQAETRSREQIAHLQQMMANLTAQLREEVRSEIGTLAREAIALSVRIAEKIVRARVAVDGEVLVRALETVLYKLEGTGSMTVTLNPEDAAVLEERPDLLASLRITALRSDRRISRGGCLVHSERQEWDATLESQLETLEEMVREMLEGGGAPRGEGEDESPLE